MTQENQQTTEVGNNLPASSTPNLFFKVLKTTDEEKAKYGADYSTKISIEKIVKDQDRTLFEAKAESDTSYVYVTNKNGEAIIERLDIKAGSKDKPLRFFLDHKEIEDLSRYETGVEVSHLQRINKNYKTAIDSTGYFVKSPDVNFDSHFRIEKLWDEQDKSKNLVIVLKNQNGIEERITPKDGDEFAYIRKQNVDDRENFATIETLKFKVIKNDENQDSIIVYRNREGDNGNLDCKDLGTNRTDADRAKREYAKGFEIAYFTHIGHSRNQNVDKPDTIPSLVDSLLGVTGQILQGKFSEKVVLEKESQSFKTELAKLLTAKLDEIAKSTDDKYKPLKDKLIHLTSGNATQDEIDNFNNLSIRAFNISEFSKNSTVRFARENWQQTISDFFVALLSLVCLDTKPMKDFAAGNSKLIVKDPEALLKQLQEQAPSKDEPNTIGKYLDSLQSRISSAQAK